MFSAVTTATIIIDRQKAWRPNHPTHHRRMNEFERAGMGFATENNTNWSLFLYVVYRYRVAMTSKSHGILRIQMCCVHVVELLLRHSGRDKHSPLSKKPRSTSIEDTHIL